MLPSQTAPIVIFFTITTTTVVETLAVPHPDLDQWEERFDAMLRTPRTMTVGQGQGASHGQTPDMSPREDQAPSVALNAPEVLSSFAGLPSSYAPVGFARDAQSTSAAIDYNPGEQDSCRMTSAILQHDFAGHGLPLTSLVIESSTCLFLVIMFVYHVSRRVKARRKNVCLFGSSVPLVSTSANRRNSVLKYTFPSSAPSAQPSLSKIEEDHRLSIISYSAASSHAPVQRQNASPPILMAPAAQRGRPSTSPLRPVFRSLSLDNLPSAGLVEMPSFLSLN
ncbi:hypothetical protein BD414DRAFT_510237 [Trametes punicea]|nr:hypothetical protein BD414DRAFT_510237 [Trametes punicea]